MNRKWFVVILAFVIAAFSATSVVPSASTSSPEATFSASPTPYATPTATPEFSNETEPVMTQFPDFPDGPEPSELPETVTPEPTVTPAPTPEPTLKPTPKPTPKPTATPAPKPSPSFTMNLYRSGAFVRQQTNYWCVPTSTQIMINIIKHRKDHSYATQLAMWKVAWANIKYKGFKPQVYGSDPQGWVAALEKFGGGDYKWVNSKSFDAALKSAVKAMAVTGRPVGLVVMSGKHAWVLHGFITTANPAKTNNFKVLSVYVTAPGYGLLKYDVKPNTKLSVEQFKTRLRKYYSSLTKEVWEGYYVTIQPVK